MALRLDAASPAAEGQRTVPVADVDSSVGVRSPDPRAVPRRLPSIDRAEPKRGFRSYHKPIRAAPLSSELTASNTTLKTPALSRLSADETPETGIIAIGMALGSPTHPQNDTMTAWRPQFMTSVTSGTSDSPSPSNDDSSKSKTRKWGIFGRSKSKRGKGSDARLEDQPTSAGSANGLARTMSSAPGHRSVRGSPQEAKSAVASPRYKTLGRSYTEPMMGVRENAPMSIPRKAIIPLPPPKDNEERTSWNRRNAPGAFQSSSDSHRGDNLLDVEIPDITMERYSIMFGHLLQNRSASSLLARRQATQDRLKAIKEGEANIRQAESSRPSPGVPVIWGSTISPMQLASRNRGAGQRLSPHMRSNTSPAMLPSPLKPSFDGPETHQGRLGSRHIAESTRQDRALDEGAAGASKAMERPQLISKFHRQLSRATIGSDGARERALSASQDDRFHIHVQSPDGRKISQSTWDSAHPAFAASTPRSHASEHSGFLHLDSPTGESSAGSLSEEDLEEVPTDPVEVSIARQISVSRQQRAMLGPLQRHVLENRRINETKSSVPRLVDPRQDPDSPKAMHRKSERVIVERA